jgi:hypothetical protein
MKPVKLKATTLRDGQNAGVQILQGGGKDQRGSEQSVGSHCTLLLSAAAVRSAEHPPPPTHTQGTSGSQSGGVLSHAPPVPLLADASVERLRYVLSMLPTLPLDTRQLGTVPARIERAEGASVGLVTAQALLHLPRPAGPP